MTRYEFAITSNLIELLCKILKKGEKYDKKSFYFTEPNPFFQSTHATISYLLYLPAERSSTHSCFQNFCFKFLRLQVSIQINKCTHKCSVCVDVYVRRCEGL